MAFSIDIGEFLEDAGSMPVVDVRSPGEFKHGHIPGAINIPLFDDNERARVGTLYRHEGQHPAILEGLDIAGRKMSVMAAQALQVARNKQMLVYCWRGGMRSASMAWLFETTGLACKVLKGGYKSYRTCLREFLQSPFRIIVLGGMTGSGKTEILQSMADQGQQVLDVEKLASHKGSAFGGIGQESQPTTEAFENMLFAGIRGMDPSKPIWVEDESKTIGSVHIPDSFFIQMRNAPLVRIDLPLEERITRLVEGYSIFPGQELLSALDRIRKRFGNQNHQPAREAIETGNFRQAAEFILQYYDKTYLYGLSRRDPSSVYPLRLNAFHPSENATEVIRFAEKVLSPQSGK